MLHDNKSNDIELAADPLPTSTWVRVAGLLGLPPEARPGFERIRFQYRRILALDREGYEWRWVAYFIVKMAYLNCGLIEIDDPPNPPIREQLTKEEVDHWFQVWKACHTRLEWRRKQPPLVRQLVLQLRDMTAHFTGERPNHGEKWLGALTEVCQEIDPAITKWQVEDALHPRMRRRRSN
jgi:hypothetical protein